MDERAEEGLRDALAFAESIIDTVRDPLLVLDGGLRVVSASREFYRTFGVTREETEGRLVYELGNHQWDIPRLRTLLEEILPQSTTFRDFEVEHRFEQIGRKVMFLNGRRLRRGPGEREMILLAIEDATERRDAERARHDAEVRFTEMVKNVRDHSIFLTDSGGVVTSWNLAAERVIGYTEAEAVGQHFSFIFSPEDLERGLPEWELRTAQEQGRAEDERWHVRKGGERFWALGIVTPLRDDKGALTGFSKILRDITERKRMEDYLRQSEKRYRLIVEGARDYAIFTTDPDGLITSWSPGAEAVFGWGAGEALGRSLDTTFTPEDRAAGVPGQERETAREKGAAPDVRWHLRKDGTRVFIEGVMRALGSAGARGFLKVGQDVTEQRRAEEELRRSRDELEERVRERTAELVASQEKALQAERLAAIGQTVTALAHEGRNALQRIAASLSRLEMRQEGRLDELALTRRAQQALGDLERLFDDVRTYAAPIRVDRKACDLSAVWRQAWAQLAPLHAPRDAQIEDLRDALKDKDPARRKRAANILAKRGFEANSAWNYLAEMLTNEKNTDVRAAAASAIADIATGIPEKAQPLVSALANGLAGSQPLEIRLVAAKALEEIGYPNNKEAIIDILDAIANGTDKDVRNRCLRALSKMPKEDFKEFNADKTLAKVLNERDDGMAMVRYASACKLANVLQAEAPDKTADVLSEALIKAKSPTEFRDVALVIAQIGAKAKPVVPYLAKQLARSQPPQIRQSAAGALNLISYPSNKDAIPAISDALANDKDWEVRQNCLWSLLRCSDLKSTGGDKVLAKLLDETDGNAKYFRYNAAMKLAEVLGEEAPDKTVDVLLQILKDKGAEVVSAFELKDDKVIAKTKGSSRHAAATRLAWLGKKASRRSDVGVALKDATKDPDPKLRESATEALKKLGIH